MKTIMKSVFVILILILAIQNNSFAAKKEVKEIKFKTSADCNHCKEKLEHNIKFEKGVTAVEVDIKTTIVTISYRTDKTDPETLRKAIIKIGYKADYILEKKTQQ